MTKATRFQTPITPDQNHHMNTWIKFYPRATATAMMEMQERCNAILLEAAITHNIPVLDLNAQLSGNPENFADFSHFTDTGAQRTAAALTNFILRETMHNEVASAPIVER